MNNKNRLSYWVLTYPAGVLLGILFQILILFRRVEIENSFNLPLWQGNLLVVSNHPSLWEPFLLVALFFKQYLLKPTKFGPWSAPDSINYNEKWYCFPIKPRFIPVERGNKRAEVRALSRMIEVLKSDQILILHPEGGRTAIGKTFSTSDKGNRIRTLKNGVGITVKKANPNILPVWISGSDLVWPIGKTFPRFWRKTKLRIGPMTRLSITDPRKSTQIITKKLLALSDEGE